MGQSGGVAAHRGERPDPRRGLRLLAASVAALVAAAAALVGVLGLPGAGAPVETSPAPSVTSRPDARPAVPTTTGDATARAVGVLAGWDRRRAAAWAAGDAQALRRLYVPGSRAGRHDLALLRRYAGRGLRVRGLTTQLVEVRVRHSSAAGLTLAVTDRVADAVVVHDGRRLRLPAGGLATRVVRLRSVGGAWLVASVRAG